MSVEAVTVDADIRELFASIGRLFDVAEAAGTNRPQLDDIAAKLGLALLELSEHRAGARDPRALRSLERAERIARAKATGVTNEQLAERFRCSSSQVSRLLTARALHDARRACFTVARATATERDDERSSEVRT